VRVIYATASPLGGSGLAEVAGYAASGLWQAGCLGQVITTRNRLPSIPPERVREVRFQPTKLLSMLPARYYYPLKRAWVDRMAARYVSRHTCHVVHGWTQEALRTLRTARRCRAVAVLERNYAHPHHSREVLEAEYAAAGIRWPGRPWPGLSRYDHWSREVTVALAEFDEADVIVVPAQYTRETMVARGVPAEKVHVLPRGVDAERLRPGPRPARPFRALCVGQVCLRKGVRYLLEAWRTLALPDAELILVGSVHEEARPLLARYRDLAGLRVEGFAKDPTPYFADASAFVLPTLDEGSAKVTSEAMAAGLPVITTPEAGSLVADGVSGFLVPARDNEALADRLAALHAHPELRSTMGAAARERILPYTWARYQAGLVALYTDTLARRRGTVGSIGRVVESSVGELRSADRPGDASPA
jgi:glycosyltransferase involved in cell wall biosynthesis